MDTNHLDLEKNKDNLSEHKVLHGGLPLLSDGELSEHQIANALNESMGSIGKGMARAYGPKKSN